MVHKHIYGNRNHVDLFIRKWRFVHVEYCLNFTVSLCSIDILSITDVVCLLLEGLARPLGTALLLGHIRYAKRHDYQWNCLFLCLRFFKKCGAGGGGGEVQIRSKSLLYGLKHLTSGQPSVYGTSCGKLHEIKLTCTCTMYRKQRESLV